tara:strand:+ start:1780 stop:2520 length:741 start_codon:yes stop_codon:yes gene_type:complete
MAKTNLFDMFKQHLIGGIHMSDEVQQSNEGVTLALSAVAEVLSKMDERLAKQEAEEIKKAEVAEAELQKSELAEMIKSIVSQAVAEFSKADEEEDDQDEEDIDDIIEEIEEEEDEEEEIDKAHEDDDDEEEVDKGKYMKSKDSNSEIATLKKQIAELQSGIDEKIQKEADTRLRKLGFREETGLKAPEVVRYNTMGVEDTTPIQKSEEPTNVVEQLAKMSYTQLRTLQHKIQSGDTDGVPRELIEG